MTPAEEYRKEFERHRKERLDLEQIVETPGWALIRLVLESTLIVWRNTEHAAPTTLDGSFARAEALGAVKALQNVINLPETLIRNRREDEARCLEFAEETENEDGGI